MSQLTGSTGICFAILQATVFAGGLEAGIYTTNTPDAVHYVLDHCDAGLRGDISGRSARSA